MLIMRGNVCLDRLDLEVETDEREHQTFQVLDEIVEETEPFRILGLVDVQQGADFRGGEGDVLVADENLKLLTSHTICWWPQ